MPKIAKVKLIFTDSDFTTLATHEISFYEKKSVNYI